MSSEDDDKDLFRKSVKVSNLMHPNKVKLERDQQPIRQREQDDHEHEDFLVFDDYSSIDLVGAEQTLSHTQSGISEKRFKQLRTGKLPPQAALDLHGMTVEQSRLALGRFITQSQQRGLKSVLVVTGKGRSDSGPILKNKVNFWLRQTQEVLAFCSALPNDGGTGAMYLLLKSRGK